MKKKYSKIFCCDCISSTSLGMHDNLIEPAARIKHVSKIKSIDSRHQTLNAQGEKQQRRKNTTASKTSFQLISFVFITFYRFSTCVCAVCRTLRSFLQEYITFLSFATTFQGQRCDQLNPRERTTKYKTINNNETKRNAKNGQKYSVFGSFYYYFMYCSSYRFTNEQVESKRDKPVLYLHILFILHGKHEKKRSFNKLI